MSLGIFGPVEPSPKKQGFYRLPDSPGHFFARKNAGNSGTTRRYGRKLLIAYLMTVIAEWHRRHPKHPLPNGDLAEIDGSSLKDHKTHDEGFAVDVYNVHTQGGHQRGAPYKNDPQHPGYGRELTIEMACLMIALKSLFRVRETYHNDPAVQKAVTEAAPGWPFMKSFAQHEDHIHVTLHPDSAISPEKIDAIIGLKGLGEKVEDLFDEFLKFAAMLRYGSNGPPVEGMQAMLNAEGSSAQPGLETDGIFGAKTKARVMEFQYKNKLTADGIVGPKTKDALVRIV